MTLLIYPSCCVEFQVTFKFHYTTICRLELIELCDCKQWRSQLKSVKSKTNSLLVETMETSQKSPDFEHSLNNATRTPFTLSQLYSFLQRYHSQADPLNTAVLGKNRCTLLSQDGVSLDWLTVACQSLNSHCNRNANGPNQ